MSDGHDTARRLIAKEREKKSGVFDLGNLGLTELPIELFEITHLCALNLISVVDERDNAQVGPVVRYTRADRTNNIAYTR